MKNKKRVIELLKIGKCCGNPKECPECPYMGEKGGSALNNKTANWLLSQQEELDISIKVGQFSKCNLTRENKVLLQQMIFAKMESERLLAVERMKVSQRKADTQREQTDSKK